MSSKPQDAIVDILFRSGTSLTVDKLVRSVRVVHGVRLSRKALRRLCYETAEVKRDGSSAYRLDPDQRLERLVRELMAA